MLGRRDPRQPSLWTRTDQLAPSPGDPFYERLTAILDGMQFDRQLEKLAAPHYARMRGRPGLPPGVYARMMLIGYFEGEESERGIAWRCADSLSLRKFLGFPLDTTTPDHSTLSETRKRLPDEFHHAVFSLVLRRVAEAGLVKGKTVGVDASTMEADAAMRSIKRRDTGEAYREYLEKLARASGMAAPTAEDLARFDRKRKGKKVSNKEWVNPNDPDAKIAKMKDGTTHLAYKPEHAVDLDTGVILAAEVHPADQGDTATGPGTYQAARNAVAALVEDRVIPAPPVTEVVADKGYFSAEHVASMADAGVRSYIAEPALPPKPEAESEPTNAAPVTAERPAAPGAKGETSSVDHDASSCSSTTAAPAPEAENSAAAAPAAPPARMRRVWADKENGAALQQAVYANRRRIRGARSKRLHRRRGEVVERTFAHLLDTGGMRRTFLHGRRNVHKRYLIHVAGFNLGVLIRSLLGSGKPKELADRLAEALAAATAAIVACGEPIWRTLSRWIRKPREKDPVIAFAAAG